mgnify:CR=1 FL=1
MLILAAMLCLTACHDDDNNTTVKTSRTVMVYMAGENNLTKSGIDERYLHSDLEEIIAGSTTLAANQRMLVFVDSLNTDNDPNSKPYIIEVKNGQATHLYDFDTDFYSCDPAMFRQILQQMMTFAPADSYGLILWGHASGWIVESDTIAQARQQRAYGIDYGTDASKSNNSKWMNITQMAKALEGLPKMEFIFADCCNMISAEAGYELRQATNYLIGSPAEIPGDGAPYDKITPYLFKDGSEMYRGIIDTYYDYYLESFKYSALDGYSIPLSAIDTRYMATLAQATHDVLEQLTDAYPEYPIFPELQAMGLVFYLYVDNYGITPSPVMYDMRAFVKTLAPSDVFQKWDATFQQAVPYYRMSMRWLTIYDNQEYAFYKFNKDAEMNGCVSMYIPMMLDWYLYSEYKYNDTFNNYGWNRIIDWSRFGWN